MVLRQRGPVLLPRSLLVMLPGRGKLFKQHHPQHPLLLLYRPVPLVPCPCCYCTTGVGGEVCAIFAVAGVWTGNDPPCPPILRDGEGIARVVEAVPTASLALLSSRR